MSEKKQTYFEIQNNFLSFSHRMILGEQLIPKLALLFIMATYEKLLIHHL